jgi:hypothetical protein
MANNKLLWLMAIIIMELSVPCLGQLMTCGIFRTTPTEYLTYSISSCKLLQHNNVQ